MLKVQNLCVNYGHINALKGISFEVKDNEIACLIGSNGAGKSSTLNAISGIVSKSSGSILFKDQDITKTRADEIVKMGISQVPEGRHVFPKVSVEENLILGTVSVKRMKKAELNQKIEEMYMLFPRLKERYKQYAGTLSGGEQQMLAIARGLMCDPQILMLDEPSLGLAPILVDEIFELILKVKKQGKTVLLVEQNASMALQISDSAYLFEIGQIVRSGSSAKLLNDSSIREAYLGG